MIEIVVNFLRSLIDSNASPCAFLTISGYYCPGCGGTRSVLALFMGRPIVSLILHPFPIYLIIFAVANIIKGIICLVKKRHFFIQDTWFWGMLWLILINFIVKDVVLFFGFDILKWAQELL